MALRRRSSTSRHVWAIILPQTGRPCHPSTGHREAPMSAATPTWDPAQYLRHAGHRTRPFTDLLARIPELPGGPAHALAPLPSRPRRDGLPDR